MTKSFFLYFSLFLTGCATLFSGTEQSVQIIAKGTDGKIFNNAVCMVMTSNNEFFMTSAPGTVLIPRDNKDIYVSCKNSNASYLGAVYVNSHYNTTNLWNIGLTIPFIVPGAIAWSIDGISGADFEYPKIINITMYYNLTSNEGAVNESVK